MVLDLNNDCYIQQQTWNSSIAYEVLLLFIKGCKVLSEPKGKGTSRQNLIIFPFCCLILLPCASHCSARCFMKSKISSGSLSLCNEQEWFRNPRQDRSGSVSALIKSINNLAPNQVYLEVSLSHFDSYGACFAHKQVRISSQINQSMLLFHNGKVELKPVRMQ